LRFARSAKAISLRMGEAGSDIPFCDNCGIPDR